MTVKVTWTHSLITRGGEHQNGSIQKLYQHLEMSSLLYKTNNFQPTLSRQCLTSHEDNESITPGPYT